MLPLPQGSLMTMRITPWLLALMLLVTPIALANDEDENKTEDRENQSGEHENQTEVRENRTEEREDEPRRDEKDDEDRGEDERDEDEDDDERKVHVEVDGLEAKIRLERETRASEDKIELRFDASDARLEVKYEAEANRTETEQKLVARFHEIIEYVDADGDGAYDEGETIASAYRLGGDKGISENVTGEARWEAITMSDITRENATGKRLESRATFGEGGVFGLVFYVFGDFTMLDGSTLQPTEAKIDILIQRYPYERDDTRLGVVLTLKAKEEFERDHEFVDADEAGVAASGTTSDVSFSLVFTWKETALVDGVDTPVRATVLKDSTKAQSERDDDGQESKTEQKLLLVLSYARGDDILHDPTAGVSYETLSAETSAVPGPGLALAAAAAGAAALLARRRRE